MLTEVESVDYHSGSQVTNTNKQTKGKTMTQANRTTLNLEHHKDFRYKNLADMKRIAFERAMEYLHGVYQIDSELNEYLKSFEVKYTNGTRSRCYQAKKYIQITIKSGAWYTYKKKTLGGYAEGIVLPRLPHTVLHIIHEYTHAIQYFRFLKNNKKGQRAGELETTANELHYMEMVSPNTLKQLTAL